MDWSFLIRNNTSLNVTTDSRKITPGCIFVALKGEHFDGNDYVDQAIRDGASYVIKGANALSELQDLAREWRRYLGLPIIAITGSNGKTTTKELTAAVLKTKYNIHYTQGNYNNSLGVPLTLLQLTKEHQLAIVEMGASHPGDIKELVEIAEPNYGLITNVGRAHLLGFGSFEGVMATKAELYDYLVAHKGTIFRNADNPYLEKMLGSAGCQGHIINYTTGTMPTGTHLIGDYNAENVSAAICVGEHFGVSKEEALAAIRAYVPSNNRSQAMKTAHNDLVIDAYNANPTSMTAAINAFKGEAYILGAMRELGDYSHLEHQNIVNMLLERKADTVYLVGEEWRDTTAPYRIFDTTSELSDYLQAHPITGARILVKGSRSNQLETIIPLL
ncbi:MAG: UDP-N-acetylmuramoyl-tripeptide--D-alanyl-D-alanine ligase [Paludibacteraceae bacterium]|nr:UDP-N-acetylmuramoyl-tripeptide--D-alanyl-D-alanine ligase [Paludibacteraceae bacterium]